MSRLRQLMRNMQSKADQQQESVIDYKNAKFSQLATGILMIGLGAMGVYMFKQSMQNEELYADTYAQIDNSQAVEEARLIIQQGTKSTGIK